MLVLAACEFSGTVRRAFADQGHIAWSCDLDPAEDGSTNHLTGDVRRWLHLQWDLIIAHPPCTYLTNAGVRWLHTRPERWSLMHEGVDLFNLFKGAAPRVCIENPIMHGYAKALCGPWTQTVQPWQFGEPQFKRTCLWLENLPKLEYTDILTPPKPGTQDHKAWSKVHRAPPGPARAKDRSRFFPGIAKAMAEQWGRL